MGFSFLVAENTSLLIILATTVCLFSLSVVSVKCVKKQNTTLRVFVQLVYNKNISVMVTLYFWSHYRSSLRLLHC